MLKFYLICAALLPPTTWAEAISYCGSQPYYPSQYTCYTGFLCPVVSDERTLKCGSACYLPEAYTCANGQLGEHPQEMHPFGIAAANSIKALNGKRVNACGRHFFINQLSCFYCPIQDCTHFTNGTLLVGAGSAMGVEVPGGQQTYIEPNGAFGFQQAHSLSVPAGSDYGGVVAYEQGYLRTTKGTGWTACPTQPGSAIYQVFAKLPVLTFGGTCVDLNIVTIDKPDGTLGAWQYT